MEKNCQVKPILVDYCWMKLTFPRTFVYISPVIREEKIVYDEDARDLQIINRCHWMIKPLMVF